MTDTQDQQWCEKNKNCDAQFMTKWISLIFLGGILVLYALLFSVIQQSQYDYILYY